MSWVNKHAIMRDLSLAQGCVPVEVAGTVSGRQKPPTPNFIEDTEEEFYRRWVGGDGDISAPDLGLIKHMLDMVRDYDAPPLQEDETKKHIEISKPNERKTKLESKDHGAGDEAQDKIPKVRKQRNVAITSLLQNIKDMEVKTEMKIKLLKPIDFSGATEKVNGWLDKQKSNTPKKKTLTLSLDPSSMFRRREVPESITAKQEQSTSSETPSSPYVQIGKYVPSKNAEEYYKKLVEVSKMKEMVMESVWSKAEIQMREIDERRKQEAELFALSLAMAKSTSESTVSPATSPATDLDNNEKLDIVRLPQHRHLLTGPCIVCNVANKDKQQTDINENIQNCSDTDNDTEYPVSQVGSEHIESWRSSITDDMKEAQSWRAKTKPDDVKSEHTPLDSLDSLSDTDSN